MVTAVGRATAYEKTSELLHNNSDSGLSLLNHLYYVLEEDYYFFIANEVTLLMITNRGIFDALVFLSRSRNLQHLISLLYRKLLQSRGS